MKEHEQYKKCFMEYKQNIQDIEKLSCELIQDKKDDVDVYDKAYIINQKAHEILRTINAYF